MGSELKNMLSIKEESTQDSEISPGLGLKTIEEETNDKKRSVLTKVLDYCLVKRELHWKTHKQFEKYKNRLIIPSIIITTLASLLTFSITIIGDVKWIILVSGSLTGISSLFQTLANTYEFSKKADAHELASEAYDQLITKIRFELLLMKNDKFIEYVYDKINEIKLNCKYIIPFQEAVVVDDK